MKDILRAIITAVVSLIGLITKTLTERNENDGGELY